MYDFEGSQDISNAGRVRCGQAALRRAAVTSIQVSGRDRDTGFACARGSREFRPLVAPDRPLPASAPAPAETICCRTAPARCGEAAFIPLRGKRLPDSLTA